MQTTKNRAELAHEEAFLFALAQGAERERAEEFAGEYVNVLEDRAGEIPYPDAPAPMPEEVWIS